MIRLVVATLTGALLLITTSGHATESCSRHAPRSMALALCKAEAAKALASKAGPLAPKLLEDAAERLVSVWNEWGREACENEHESCARHAASLLDAATTYAAAGSVGSALQIGNAIISPKSKIYEPGVVFGAAELVTHAYLDLGMLGEAAHRLGEVAERMRGSEHAEIRRATSQLLFDAHRLWLLVGDRVAAAKARKALIEGQDPLHPYQRRDLDLNDAKMAVLEARWQDAIDVLAEGLRQPKNTNLQWEIEARAMLARAYQGKGDARAAERVDRALLLRWQKRSKTEHIYWAHIEAVAEALLREAERKRTRATWSPPPSSTNFDTWSKKQRQTVIPEVIAAYGAIDELTPAPRPRWRVAAAAGKADTWRRFDEIVVAAAGKASPARVADETFAAFEVCTSLSRELKYFGAETHACESGIRAYAPTRGYDALWFAPSVLPETGYEPTFMTLEGKVVTRGR